MSIARLNSFANHCRELGMCILRNDLLFIDKMLNKYHQSEFKGVLDGYIEEWQKGVNEESSPLKAQGKGRFRANTWLRLKSG